MARAGATKYAAHDAWRRENDDALRAACKLSKVRMSDCLHVLEILTKRAKPDGRSSESIAQLAQTTDVGESQVKRALDALTAVGVLQTVTRGRSSGAGGGKGRPSVRVLSFLTVIEAATGDPEGLGITQNDRALMRDRPRTNERMTAHLSALPHGLSSTELPTTLARDADAEPATGAYGVGVDTHKGHPALSGWEAQVCDAAAEQLAAGAGGRVKNRDAWKRTVIRKAVHPALVGLQARYPRLDGLTPRDSAWHELVTVLTCLATEEAPSETTWEALRPYKLALVASDG